MPIFNSYIFLFLRKRCINYEFVVPHEPDVPKRICSVPLQRDAGVQCDLGIKSLESELKICKQNLLFLQEKGKQDCAQLKICKEQLFNLEKKEYVTEGDIKDYLEVRGHFSKSQIQHILNPARKYSREYSARQSAISEKCRFTICKNRSLTKKTPFTFIGQKYEILRDTLTLTLGDVKIMNTK